MQAGLRKFPRGLSFPSRLIQCCRLTIGCIVGEKLKGVNSTKFPTELFLSVLWLVFGFLWKKHRLGSVGRPGSSAAWCSSPKPNRRRGYYGELNLVWCGGISNFLFRLFLSDHVGACPVEGLYVVELTRKERNMVLGQRPAVFKGIHFV